MDTLKWLEQATCVKSYEVHDFRQWSDGLYYKVKIVFSDQSILFAKEYIDSSERNYSFHWQTENNALIMRWDNAPHYRNIETFPHHKHDENDCITESTTISFKDVIKIIQRKIC